MVAPRYTVIQQAEWEQHLATEHIEAWYHNPRLYAAARRLGLAWLARLTAPRGYSRQDAASGPSAGDLVVVHSGIHELARQAYRRLEAGGTPTRKQVDALLVALHERTHCLVRLNPDGSAVAQDLEAYSHPGTALAALRHAHRRGYPINAFTGLLRRHRLPAEAWVDGLKWFGAALAEREIA